MAREIDLKRYLPEFVGEYREIKEILRVEEPEIRTVADAVERARDCAFIGYCGEYEIGLFERMMNVFPAPDDTLKERQARILIRWNESPPYTLAALKEKLAAICGKSGFSVGGDFDKYRLEISVTLTRAGQVDELERLLQRIVPANMEIVVYNTLTAEPSAELFVGGTVSACALAVV